MEVVLHIPLIAAMNAMHTKVSCTLFLCPLHNHHSASPQFFSVFLKTNNKSWKVRGVDTMVAGARGREVWWSEYGQDFQKYEPSIHLAGMQRCCDCDLSKTLHQTSFWENHIKVEGNPESEKLGTVFRY